MLNCLLFDGAFSGVLSLFPEDGFHSAGQQFASRQVCGDLRDCLVGNLGAVSKQVRQRPENILEDPNAGFFIAACRLVYHQDQAFLAVQDLHVQDRLRSRLVLPHIQHIEVNAGHSRHVADILLVQQVGGLLLADPVIQVYVRTSSAGRASCGRPASGRRKVSGRYSRNRQCILY